METKLYHAGFDKSNHCIHELHKNCNWSPALTSWKCILFVQNQFSDYDVDECVRREIGKLFKSNREEHDKIAKEWTEKYAFKDNYKDKKVDE